MPGPGVLARRPAREALAGPAQEASQGSLVWASQDPGFYENSSILIDFDEILMEIHPNRFKKLRQLGNTLRSVLPNCRNFLRFDGFGWIFTDFDRILMDFDESTAGMALAGKASGLGQAGWTSGQGRASLGSGLGQAALGWHGPDCLSWAPDPSQPGTSAEMVREPFPPCPPGNGEIYVEVTLPPPAPPWQR